jgi:hypothetical protein
MGAGGVARWTDAPEMHEAMQQVVTGIRACQGPDGYAMAFPRNESDRQENPNYVTSWLTHGLLEAAQSGSSEALSILRAHFDWFNGAETLPHFLPPLGGADIPGPPFFNRTDPQFKRGHAIYLINQVCFPISLLSLSKLGD